MKNIIIIIALCFSFNVEAQINDTIYCVIDTTVSYVSVERINREFTSDSLPSYCVQVKANYGNYYNQYLDKARVSFVSHIDGGQGYPNILRMSRKDFNIKPYYTEAWINKQTHIETISDNLPCFFMDVRVFMVFKTDLDNLSNDSISIHQVAVSLSQTQPFSQDTIIAIIDKSADFVNVRHYGDTISYFNIKINYSLHLYNNDIPYITFEEIPMDYKKDNFYLSEIKKKICKTDLNRYMTVKSEWIYKQKILYNIERRLGFTWWSRPNYIIYKDELDYKGSDSIIMHQVFLYAFEIVD